MTDLREFREIELASEDLAVLTKMVADASAEPAKKTRCSD
jgi:hypothetical protein